MRKFCFAILLMLSVFVSTPSFADVDGGTGPGPYASDPERKDFLPFGDSLTAGWSYDNTVPGGYRLPLWNLLTAAGIKLNFLGSNQLNCIETLPDCDHWGQPGMRMDSMVWYGGPVLHTVPAGGIPIILAGTNDTAQVFDLPNFKTRARALLDLVTAQSPNLRGIIVIEMPPIYNSGAGVGAVNANVPIYNAKWAEVVSEKAATGYDVRFVRIYDKFRATETPVGAPGYPNGLHPTTLSDGAHMTQLGYNMIAQEVAPVSLSMLGVPLPQPDMAVQAQPDMAVAVQPDMTVVAQVDMLQPPTPTDLLPPSADMTGCQSITGTLNGIHGTLTTCDPIDLHSSGCSIGQGYGKESLFLTCLFLLSIAYMAYRISKRKQLS